MDFFAHYLMPPLVGAFIGYMTNYVAIRMLFRPLRVWRVLGVRVPFTPGIIPARRDELAAKLGRTVGRHLVTSEDAGKALEKRAFQAELRQFVADKVDVFLTTEFGPPATLLTRGDRNWGDDAVAFGRDWLTKTLCAHFRQPEFEEQLRALLLQQSEMVLTRNVDEFVSEDVLAAVRSHVECRIGDLVENEDFRDTLTTFIDQKLDAVLSSDKQLRTILPQAATDMLFALIRSELPPFLERMSNVLEDPVVRERLIDRLSNRVGELLRSLGGWSGFLAGFVNPERISARLPEFLDRAGEEIGEWLSEDATQAYIANQVLERLSQALDKPVRELVQKLSAEDVAKVRLFLAGETVAFVRSPGAARLGGVMVEGGLRRIGKRPLRSVLEQLLPEHGLTSAQEFLTREILKALRSPDFEAAMARFIEDRLTDLVYAKPIGRLVDRIPAELQKQLPDIAYTQLLDILRRELPPLMESLNVEKMVEDNVNSLPILEVEGILLTIMRRHFVYINLFGALLGFLIGCLNILW